MFLLLRNVNLFILVAEGVRRCASLWRKQPAYEIQAQETNASKVKRMCTVSLHCKWCEASCLVCQQQDAQRGEQVVVLQAISNCSVQEHPRASDVIKSHRSRPLIVKFITLPKLFTTIQTDGVVCQAVNVASTLCQV